MKIFIYFGFILLDSSYCLDYFADLNEITSSSSIIEERAKIQFPRMEDIETNNIETMNVDDVTEYQNGTSDISSILGKQQANNQILTLINIGIQSKLLAPPGTQVQIYYEVTNLRNQPTLYSFQVSDEKSFLIRIIPTSAIINPEQTINVILTLYISPNTEVGTKDKITFYSHSLSSVSQSAYLTTTSSSGIQDSTKPSLSYSYGNRCIGKSSEGSCAGNIWTVEINAYDSETGLLKLQSLPKGIFYRNEFTAGTKDTVVATYSASCCQPKVTITAFDLAGNQRSISLDVTDIWLSEAGIAAVVLGVILLIILIIILVFCIRWCCKKRKASREMPIYRTERVIERP